MSAMSLYSPMIQSRANWLMQCCTCNYVLAESWKQQKWRMAPQDKFQQIRWYISGYNKGVNSR